MSDGGFTDSTGRHLDYTVIEVHDYDGEVFTGEEVEEHLSETDRLFYSITDGEETFYRWVAGPFQDMSDVGQLIEDEADAYEEASA